MEIKNEKTTNPKAKRDQHARGFGNYYTANMLLMK